MQARRSVCMSFATVMVTVATAAITSARVSGQELPVPNSTMAIGVPPPRLPGNLQFPRHLGPVLEAMWRGSPAFRRQCARLAEAPHVSVLLNIGMMLPGGAGQEAHAVTRLERMKGHGISAMVWLDLVNPEEYIAHELEHVLEWIDGVDVRVLSARSMRGVERLATGFETARAREIGVTVARELRN